jgi:hypothetical protein
MFIQKQYSNAMILVLDLMNTKLLKHLQNRQEIKFEFKPEFKTINKTEKEKERKKNLPGPYLAIEQPSSSSSMSSEPTQEQPTKTAQPSPHTFSPG